MRKWLSALWVRNIIGAVVAAAALGVIIATTLGDQWATYRSTVDPEVVVPKGQSGTADGYTWSVESIKHLNRNPMRFGPALPEGSVLTVVTLDRSGPPRENPETCTGVITDGERRWASERIGGLGPMPPDGVAARCEKPGLLQFSFVVPQQTVLTALDVTTSEGRLLVRMLL
ncbi:hypothetical protein [Mycolicibacterium celeriflavum]|uniref:hypothetical protein n=1 Tax=Mycolicibacterium celeriflavum TaxID=1249101 RepID=UPI003CFAD36E